MKLTVAEAAECLEIPASTVERWIRQGRIPVQRGSEGVFFKESVLRKWAERHAMTYNRPDGVREGSGKTEAQDLYAAIKNGMVCHDVPGKNVDDALSSAVDRIDFLSSEEKQRLVEKLKERESLASTGIGKGVAVPHPRNAENSLVDQPAIVTCFLENKIDYNAVDDQPVFVLFLLLSQSVKSHLNLLSRLSFCLRSKSFVDFLKTRPSGAALLEKIQEFENRLDA